MKKFFGSEFVIFILIIITLYFAIYGVVSLFNINYNVEKNEKCKSGWIR